MKQSKRITATMIGIFVLTLMYCGAIQAAESKEPSIKEILAEGIPHPPVILEVKRIYTGDASSPGIEEMLVEDIVSLPPRKINKPEQPYVVKK